MHWGKFKLVFHKTRLWIYLKWALETFANCRPSFVQRGMSNATKLASQDDTPRVTRLVTSMRLLCLFMVVPHGTETLVCSFIKLLNCFFKLQSFSIQTTKWVSGRICFLTIVERIWQIHVLNLDTQLYHSSHKCMFLSSTWKYSHRDKFKLGDLLRQLNQHDYFEWLQDKSTKRYCDLWWAA